MERAERGDELVVTFRGRPRLRVTPANAGTLHPDVWPSTTVEAAPAFAADKRGER